MDAPREPAPHASDGRDRDDLPDRDHEVTHPEAARTHDTALAPDGAGDAPAEHRELGDGGVLARIARRTAIIAGGLGVAVLMITGTGLVWPGWFARPVGLVAGVLLIAVCTTGAATLLRRSAAWTALTAASLRDSPGVAAVIGEPRPLHGPGPTVIRRRRRFPAQVVPIRSATGPWVGGGVLLVHGRADAARLHGDDDAVVRWVAPRGPYLVERTEDGALFAAERSAFGAW